MRGSWKRGGNTILDFHSCHGFLFFGEVVIFFSTFLECKQSGDEAMLYLGPWGHGFPQFILFYFIFIIAQKYIKLCLGMALTFFYYTT